MNSSHWWIGARQMILGTQIFWMELRFLKNLYRLQFNVDRNQ